MLYVFCIRVCDWSLGNDNGYYVVLSDRPWTSNHQAALGDRKHHDQGSRSAREEYHRKGQRSTIFTGSSCVAPFSRAWLSGSDVRGVTDSTFGFTTHQYMTDYMFYWRLWTQTNPAGTPIRDGGSRYQGRGCDATTAHSGTENQCK